MLGTILGWLGFLVAVGVVAVVVWAIRADANAVRTLKFDGTKLIALKSDSSVRWTYDVGAPIADVHGSISTMTGGGKGRSKMTVANPGPATKTASSGFSLKSASGLVLAFVTLARSPVDGKLIAFAHDGTKLWEMGYADLFGKAGARLGLDWTLRQTDDYSVGFHSRTFYVFQHASEWPWLVVTFDGIAKSGRVTGRFLNAGEIRKLLPFATNTQAFLVIMGISESRDAGFVALVDALEGSGASPEEAGSKYACKDCSEGDAFRYIVFPRSEVNLASHSRVNRVDDGGQAYTEGNGRGGSPLAQYVVTTEETHRPEPRIEDNDIIGPTYANYVFDYPFEKLLDAPVGDNYWKVHKYLEKTGQLKHQQAACPDRDGMPLVRMWDAKRGWRDVKREKAGG